MLHRGLINIALVIVITLLILLVIYEPGIKKLQGLPKLTDLTKDQVNLIRLEKQDEPMIELNKNEQNHWVIKTPFKLPANQFRIETLLNVLADHDYQLIDNKELSLTEVKLVPPIVTLTFNQFVMAFGDKSPINNGQRYVQVNGQVYLMLDSVYHFLVDDAVVFVSLSPLGEYQKITEIQTPNYHLRAENGRWISLQPLIGNEDTSPDALNSLIDDWQLLQALSVKQYVATLPKGTIEIHLQGQTTPLQFHILATEPNFILALPEKNVQYQLISEKMAKLLQLPLRQEVSGSS